MIYLSFISVDTITPDDYLKIRNKNLREQAASANNIAVRRERTASRILLEDILNRFYPKLDCDYPVRITEKGKPYIVGENVPYFSFTNKNGKIFIAVSDDSIGIDYEEKQVSLEKAISISNRFFSERECHEIKDIDSFYRCWTLKEAYAKAVNSTLPEELDKYLLENTNNFKFFETDNSTLTIYKKDIVNDEILWVSECPFS